MLIHADNFNYYGDDETNLLDGVYAEATNLVSLVADPDGVSASRVIQTLGGVGSDGLRWVMPAPHATVGVARRLWLEHLPTKTSGGGLNTAKIADFRDASNNVIANVWVTTTGAIVVNTGEYTSGTVLGQTTGPVLTAGGWYHIEVKFVVDDVAGSVEVRVEGIPVIAATGLNTGVADVAQIFVGNTSNGASGSMRCFCKDLVVWDGSGTQNNDFLGSVIVYELFTTSDDTMGGWTSTAANGYSVLDNNPPADGVSYIAADDSPPAAAVFGLSNLPADVTSVKGIVTRVRAAKIDGGDGSLQISLRSGVDDDAGADRPITVAQTYWSDVSEEDPATSAPWLPGAVDDALLVIDRTV